MIVWWPAGTELETDELNEAMRAVYDGQHCPVVEEVPDTGSDDGAVVVSAEPLNLWKIQAIWERHFDRHEPFEYP
ncbi:hypothetical protein A3C96_00930 [Candidatus Uhrbacteria bacterium RIFCSPHIGHO2_02_FULL_60_10]|uniref:Uncharacterized protein n=1 Tax=Candidatus Uhrbacteria bacterium RIFCSPHIGHO2_02_FULL_60_10 TaxID=1802392 RepID=A0A1F7U500_9BACT|nr:MAG: hypothetical protein A3C96_00930 [Candidatus Uhrbacteria bacterium RIFCSPHIGHO2_02_FULL_60_10]